MSETQVKGKNVGDRSITDVDIDLSGAPAKTPLVAADSFAIIDSATNLTKRTLLSTLTTYLAALFAALNHGDHGVAVHKATSTDHPRDTRNAPASFLVTQAAHGFVVGSTIKLSGSTWVKTKADSSANAGTDGVVSQIVDAGNFYYVKGGFVPGTYTVGEDYFLSTGTLGAVMILSDPEVWTVGQVREFIGVGVSAGLMVNIDIGIEITAAYIDKYVTEALLDATAKLSLLRTAGLSNLEVQFGTMALYKFWTGTAAAYAAITPKDATTIYHIEE
jgi:hypothetical protein